MRAHQKTDTIQTYRTAERLRDCGTPNSLSPLKFCESSGPPKDLISGRGNNKGHVSAITDPKIKVQQLEYSRYQYELPHYCP